MSDGFEYRVVWRRERAPRSTTRLYQTFAGAREFAGFIEAEHDAPLGSTLDGNLSRLGGVVALRIERREVGAWETIEGGKTDYRE